MVADDVDGILHKLWKNKIYISLTLILLVAVIFGVYYYRQSNDRGAELSQEELNFNALNGTYNQLSLEHLSLVSANEDLNDRYSNLSGRYNDLSNNQSSILSEYQKLNNSIGKLQESGTVIAIYYKTYKSGTTQMPNVTVEVTAYNVGDQRDEKLTIKCRVLFDGTLSLNEQTFTGVNPLEKRTAKWEFTDMTQVDKIWVE